MPLQRNDNSLFGIKRFSIPIPFPVDPVNVYFVDRPVPTLIDTPPRGPSFMALLEKELGHFGYAITDIRRIVITHPHFDHYGLARDIMSRSGAELWVPGGTEFWFEGYEESLRKDEQFHEELLLKAGAPFEWIVEVNRRLWGWVEQYGCAVTPSRYLKEGDAMDLDSPFTIKAVPGHTPWCIMIYNSEDKFAFTGDFLLGQISSNPLIQRPSIVADGYKSLKALISSLTMVMGMDVRMALPGHGAIIKDPAKRIRSLLDFIFARKALVLHVLRQGEQTPFEMICKIFPRLERDELFLAVSEIMGYLELLEDEGRAKRTEDKLLRFSPVEP
jgi:glyoxylase-like metal-dependent hydrolase (beta-lactamase superfamily II)